MHCTDFTVRPLSTAQMILYPLHRRLLSTVQTVPYPLHIGPLTIAGKTAPHPYSIATGRESAVEYFGGGSGGYERALPIGFLGGKAR